MTSPYGGLVVKVPGIGEELSQALQPLFQGIAIQQRSAELQVRYEELRDAQQAREQAKARYDAEQAQLAETGEALRTALLPGETQDVTLGAIPIGGGLLPASTKLKGFTPLGEALLKAPAKAIPALAELSRPALAAQAERKQAAQLHAANQAVLDRMPTGTPEQLALKQEVQDFTQIVEAGRQLPGPLAAKMFPRIFAGAVDPQQVNAAANLMEKGASWGQARRAAGIPPQGAGGLPDDFRIVKPPKEPDVSMRRAQGLGKSMDTELVGTPTQPAPLEIARQNNIRLNVAGSALLDMAEGKLTWRELLGKVPMSQAQKQLAFSLTRLGAAYIYAMSGAQIGQYEVGRWFAGHVPLESDDAETVRQKWEAIAQDREAVRIIEGGGNAVELISNQLQEMVNRGEDKSNPSLFKSRQAMLQAAIEKERDPVRRNSVLMGDSTSVPEDSVLENVIRPRLRRP